MVIDKIADSSEVISSDRSRCLRMRFNRNECRECTDICPSGAISIRDDVSIDSRQCSECMLCVSACPSDCLEIKSLDFYSVLARLRNIRNSVTVPVLGCNAGQKLQAHVKTPCLGFLSEQHMLALTVFLDTGLHINITGCSDCKNSFIVDEIRQKLERCEERSSLNISGNITLVEDERKLNYREISYDRRGFFNAVRNLIFVQATGLFEGNDPLAAPLSYSAKKVPLRKDLVNRILVYVKGNNSGLLENYFYTVRTRSDCNNCFACVGMCPAGALKIGGEGADSALSFNASLCSGCGLCREFCSNMALDIERGFSGINPFEFIPLNRDVEGGV